jgi:hypothetical protein
MGGITIVPDLNCRIMEGEESLPLYSPECIARSPSFRDAVHLLPPITLFHGQADYSIPYAARYLQFSRYVERFLALYNSFQSLPALSNLMTSSSLLVTFKVICFLISW